MKDQEKRILPQATSELRALSNEADENQHIIEGKGIVFNQPSERLGGFFIEYIDPQALEQAELRGMISLFNHDSNYVLGSADNKTLTYEIDSQAMRYRVIAPSTQTIQDLVLAPIKRGDVKGSSFIFSIKEGGDYWEKNADDVWVRYVRKIEQVYEVGPVTMPAYSQTTTDYAKRSFDYFIKQHQEQEKAQATFYKRNLAAQRLKRLKLS